MLQVTHEIPMAGHMGRNKTTQRTLRRFYWPTIFRDVKEFCRTCPDCQKASSRKGPRAPLIPLPVIEESFRRIAMDIVGPLPRSWSGNKYILVLCDYATRYPEALPLKTIDADHIAEALIKYLGHVVGGGVVRPEPPKLEAVRTFPIPQTKKQVQTFLGLSGYYRKFIRDYAAVAVPLTDLTNPVWWQSHRLS